jgi:preprotein translocase subunit YajC
MWWPYLVLVVILGGLLLFSQRKRRNQLAEQMVRMSQIGFGSEVMTTSGLYGTVVAKNDDGTVQLAIAPGVEVKCALAALRDPESLPVEYRRPIMGEDGGAEDDGGGAGHTAQ